MQEENPDLKKIEEDTKRIQNLSGFMNYLLNDFLDINKIANKAFVLIKSLFDIRECIKEIKTL